MHFFLPITGENAKEGSKIPTNPDEKDDNFLKGVSFTTIGKSDLKTRKRFSRFFVLGKICYFQSLDTIKCFEGLGDPLNVYLKHCSSGAAM